MCTLRCAAVNDHVWVGDLRYFIGKNTQLNALGRLSEASAGSLAHLSLIASYQMLVENMSFARDIPHFSDVYVCVALL